MMAPGPLLPFSASPRGWAARLLLVLAIALAGLTLYGHLRKPMPVFYGDQPRYLSIASDLLTLGRFTNGAPQGGVPAERPPGMWNVPLYPELVALLARLDPRLASTTHCLSEHQSPACPNDLGILVPVQIGMAAATLLLLWFSALVATRSEPVAWTALVLASLGCFEYGDFVHLGITETLNCLLFAAFSLSLLCAVRRSSFGAAVLAGVLLGLSALTRPAYAYLAYALLALSVIGALALLRPRWRAPLGSPVALGLALSLGSLITLGPWLLRNWLEVGHFAISNGYGGAILAQRVAYDAMTPREFLAAWIYWLPDFGHSLAKALFAPDWYVQLGWQEPGTYYYLGDKVIGPETLVAAGSADAQVGYIIRTMVLPHPVKFALVTLPLIWRGLWFGKYFSVVSFPLLVAALVAERRRRGFDLLVLTLPGLFMLVFQALVSVNTARYNVVLIPPFAIGAAVCFVALFQRLQRGRALRFRRIDPI
jgi:hypothetical protein